MSKRKGCLIHYAVGRALVAAASIIAATLDTAVSPAFSQSLPRFPIFEISATTETSRTAPAVVRLRPSELQTDHLATEADWLELSYSPASLSDQLFVLPVSDGTLSTVCDTGLPNSQSSLFAPCSVLNAPISGNWAFSFKWREWNGTVDSDGWSLKALLHDVTIAAVSDSSDLSTPLDQFTGASTLGVSKEIVSDLGISKTSTWGQSISGMETIETPPWGISVRTNSGQEVIGTSEGVQAYQHVTIASTDLFAGITPLGPLVGVDATFGALSVSAAALDLTGQFQTAATISLQMGDLALSYVDGPGGSGIAGLFKHDPFNMGFSVNSSDVGATLEYDLGNGGTLKGSWSGLNGFQVAFVTSISLENPVTVPLGAGSFSLTSPQPGNSTPAFRFRWPRSVAMPIPSSEPPATAPVTPVVLPATSATDTEPLATDSTDTEPPATDSTDTE